MPIYKGMKKILFFNNIIFTLTALVCAMSCNLININNSESSDTIEAPVIENGAGGWVISPATVTGTLYYNIFRYEVTDGTSSGTIVEGTTTSIGQVIPYTDTKANTYSGTVSFIDYYTDTSKYYQYYIRYKTSHAYRYSKVTGTYSGSGTSGVKAITNNTGLEKIQIALDSSQYIISFASTDVTMPTPFDATDTFDVMVGLNNGVSTYLYPMTKDTANNKYSLSLRNVLPSDFMDVTLTMTCIIGQTDEKKLAGSNSETTLYTTYHWTSALAAEATIDATAVSTFKVPSTLNDNTVTDYTPTANRVNVTPITVAQLDY